MHLISIAIVVCLHFSLGYTNDDAANTNSEASQQTSLSRAKRGSYDMMRLGRGLHMLRLGKRNYDPATDEDRNVANALLWYLTHEENNAGEFDPYLPNIHEDDSEEPVHWRYRRSTAASNVAVPAEVVQQAHSASKEVVPVDVKGVKGDELLVDIPDDYYLTDEDLDDSIIEPQEGGDNEDKRSLGMLRLGKRQLSMLRLGKRNLGMLRLGKRDPESDEEKRSLGMLRLGKRQLSMLRLGKRSLGMLRLGKRPDENQDEGFSDDDENILDEEGKRSMSMLRLGKRPMGMLRLGKRPMGMLRLGKRPMSMLRLGKRPMGMLRLGKRPMGMLRLGKRPMGMLRLGKREDEDKRDLSKRSAI